MKTARTKNYLAPFFLWVFFFCLSSGGFTTGVGPVISTPEKTGRDALILLGRMPLAASEFRTRARAFEEEAFAAYPKKTLYLLADFADGLAELAKMKLGGGGWKQEDLYAMGRDLRENATASAKTAGIPRDELNRVLRTLSSGVLTIGGPTSIGLSIGLSNALWSEGKAASAPTPSSQNPSSFSAASIPSEVPQPWPIPRPPVPPPQPTPSPVSAGGIR